MKTSGIYSISNLVDGKQYIGSSSNLSKRLGIHLWALENNRHGNKHLQSAWNKFGHANFLWAILEFCKDGVLLEREQFYIDKLSPGYNILPTAGSTLGRSVSPQTKEKMSIVMKGRPSPLKGRKLSPDTKKRISEALKGRDLGDRWRRKISESLIGNSRASGKRSKEFAEECRKRNLGKKLSEEHKQKISKALKGKPKKKIAEVMQEKQQEIDLMDPLVPGE